VAVFRDPTIRKNVEYVVEICNGDDDMYNKLVEHTSKYTVDDLIICYVSSITLGKELRSKLEFKSQKKVSFYHNKAEQKEDMIDQWMGRQQKQLSNVMIATTALGCGLDVGDVRLVIYAGMPHTLSEFVQGTGRAGRDGHLSYSVLLANTDIKLKCSHKAEGINAFVNTTGCRRSVLDFYMDGKERTNGCQIDEMHCDICRRSALKRTPQVLPPVANFSTAWVTPALPGVSVAQQMHIVPVNLNQRLAKQSASPTKTIVNPYLKSQLGATGSAITPTPRLDMRHQSRTTSAYDRSDEVRQKRHRTGTVNDSDHIKRGIMNECLVYSQAIDTDNAVTKMSSDLKTFLDYFIDPMTSRCLVCKIHGVQGNECPDRTNHAPVLAETEKVRKGINWKVSLNNPNRSDDQKIPSYVVCFRPGCFVPQSLCPHTKGKQEKCVYRDVLLDTIYIMLKIRPADELVPELKRGKLYLLLTTLAADTDGRFLRVHEVFVQLCRANVSQYIRGYRSS
jgi:superfamily II DNA helicase RecQ